MRRRRGYEAAGVTAAIYSRPPPIPQPAPKSPRCVPSPPCGRGLGKGVATLPSRRTPVARRCASNLVKPRQARRLTARRDRQRDQRCPPRQSPDQVRGRLRRRRKGTACRRRRRPTAAPRSCAGPWRRASSAVASARPRRLRLGVFDGAICVEPVEHPQQPVDRAKVALGDAPDARRSAGSSRAIAPAHDRAWSRPARRAPWRRSDAPLAR